ncbi:LuxR C-terminal-related transcriptional regulator [Mariniblastus sp.]|nr:LuxR C-terminal-related transcriptional regulator [Mariniblastus sp.]
MQQIDTIQRPDVDRFLAPYFFLSADMDRRLLYVSPSVESVLGFPPKELVGKVYDDFIDTEHSLYDSVASAEDFAMVKAKAAYGETLHAVKNVNQETVILRIASYTEYSDPETKEVPVGFRCLIQDVTSVYQIDQMLKSHLMVLGNETVQISDREQQVLNFLLEGRLNKSIAKEIDITERGVERIRARLMSKFKARSAAELARKATVEELSTELHSVGKKLDSIEKGERELSLFESLLKTTPPSV